MVYSAAVYARTSVNPLHESLRSALGLTDNQMSLLQGPALALPIVALSVPLGLLIDRISRARLLVVLAALDALGAALTAWSSTFAALVAARGLVGLVSFGTNPVALSVLADLYAPTERGRAMTVLSLAYTGGAAAAFALGGVLLQAGGGPAAWRWTLGWLSVPLFLVTLLTLKMCEPMRSGTVVKHPTLRGSFQEIWDYRRVIAPLLALIALAEVALGALLVWGAPAFERAFRVPVQRVDSLIAAALVISGLCGPVFGGVLGDLCERSGGRSRTLSSIGWLNVLSLPVGFYVAAPNFVTAAVFLVLFLTFMTAVVVMEVTLFTIAVPNELRGLCMALVVACSVLVGTGIAPLIVSVVSGALGGASMAGQALTGICVMTSALSAGVAFGTRRTFAAVRVAA